MSEVPLYPLHSGLQRLPLRTFHTFSLILFGKCNGSRTCLIQTFVCAGTNLGRVEVIVPGKSF